MRVYDVVNQKYALYEAVVALKMKGYMCWGMYRDSIKGLVSVCE